MSLINDNDIEKARDLFLGHGIQVGAGMILGSLLSGGFLGTFLGVCIIIAVYAVKDATNNDESI